MYGGSYLQTEESAGAQMLGCWKVLLQHLVCINHEPDQCPLWLQIEKLQEQLAEKVETPSPPREEPLARQNSFYSHWNGSSLFGGNPPINGSLQTAASSGASPKRPASCGSTLAGGLDRTSSHGMPLNGSRAPSTLSNEFHMPQSKPANGSAGIDPGEGLSKILSRMSGMGLGSRSASPFR